MEQRLVKTGLILFRHNQHIEVLVELRFGLGLSDMAAVFPHVQFRLGVLLVAVPDRPGKGNQNLNIIISLLLNIPLDLMIIAYRRQTGGCDHHHLPPSADFMPGGLPKRLHDDL